MSSDNGNKTGQGGGDTPSEGTPSAKDPALPEAHVAMPAAHVKIHHSADGPHSIPPPLPHSTHPQAHSAAPAPAPPWKSKGFLAAAFFVAAGAAALGAFWRFRSSSFVNRFVPAPEAVSESADAPDEKTNVVEVPPEVASANDTSACIESHFPENSLGAKPDIAFVCGERDVWRVYERLQALLAANGPSAGTTLWNNLGLYQLAAAASLRTSCCTGVSVMEATVPKTPCAPLVDQLRALGPEPKPLELANYERLVRCLIEHKVRLPEAFTSADEAAMRAAVKAYFPEAAAESASGSGSAGAPATGAAGSTGLAGGATQ